MRLIIPPENKRLVWYLALEEYLARDPKEELLFFWTVPPTVIFGRHQVMQNEVNLPFCREHGIATYRRKSGGGCVYADRGNLMISYISPSTHSEQVFQMYLHLLADALRHAGYPAVTTEHNDILVHDHKVSGNACYALPSATIVHGTLLWDVDFDTLSQALTPPPSKLLKHGVASVRQRVLNLSSLDQRLLTITSIDDLRSALIVHFGDIFITTESLAPSDLLAVDQLELTYLSPSFINDKI